MKIRKMKKAELEMLRNAYSADHYLLDGEEFDDQRTTTMSLVNREGCDAVKAIIEFVLNDPEQTVFAPSHEAKRHGSPYVTEDTWVLKRWSPKYKKTACVKVWHLYSGERLTIGVSFEA